MLHIQNNYKKLKRGLFLALLSFGFLISIPHASAVAGCGAGFAWSEKAGLISFAPAGSDCSNTTSANYGVIVSTGTVTGYAWGAQTGWIHMAGTYTGGGTYGVLNDGTGKLSGFAWSEKAGLISFAAVGSNYSNDSAANYGVSINGSGNFQGYAWGAQTGWIHMAGTYTGGGTYGATTTWVPNTAPTITSPTATSITATGATLGANITSNGGASITDYGTCWGASSSPTTNCTHDGAGVAGVFTEARTGMANGTYYYYRGYATNSVGTTYSSDATFTTLTVPTVTAIAPTSGANTGSVSITSITGTQFVAGATVKLTKSGQSDISCAGFTVTNSTTLSTGSCPISGAVGGTWNVVVTNTDSQTGTLTNGFTVNVLPTVTTSAASSIATTSVTGNGNVTADGGAAVTDRGFYYVTDASSGSCTGASGGTQVTAGSGTGIYTASISSLTADTYYCYRSYAANTAGNGYGSWVSFETTPNNEDTVFAASVSKAGGASVIIVSSASSGGRASDNVWFAPSGTTSFSAGLTMTTATGSATTILAPATAGAYRMFVINASGNYSVQSTAILTVDNINPTVTVTNPPTGSYNSAGWTALAPTFSCADSGSGCDTSSCKYSYTTSTYASMTSINCTAGIPAPIEGTNKTLYVAAKDLAGNTGTNSYTGFTYDTTAPSSVASDADGVWHTSAFDVTLNCADATAGCDKIYYCTNVYGDPTCTPDTNYVTPGSTFHFASQGEYVLRLKGVDLAGNATTAADQANHLKLDSAPPANVGISSISADSSTQITVTAKTAVDAGAGLAATPYQFKKSTSELGWQLSNVYIDTGLTPNTSYSYQVQAKDVLGNASDYSVASSKYTLANAPGTPSLTVDSASQITVNLLADSNPPGTNYLITNTTNSNANSSWTSDTSWISSGLTCDTEYIFTVKAKNGDSVETTTSTASATTSACPSQISAPAGGGGGGMAISYLSPTAPLNGFQILINGGSTTTNTQNVNLTIRGSVDTLRMSISNDANFTNAVQESYAMTKAWKLSDGQGQKTVYLKFFTAYGVSSNTITATINYQAPSILNPIINFINPPEPQNPPEIIPIPPQPPVVEAVPKKAPEALQNIWNVLPIQAINNFVLSPVPQEIGDLVQKFPQLAKTLQKIGVSKITDVSKLAGNNLILPNISEITGVSSPELSSGQLASAQGIPLDSLTVGAKEKIPTEILFAKTSGGLIDFNTTLSLNEQGHPQQQLTALVNQPIQLIVKPDQPAKAIRGYFVFKQNGAKPAAKISASSLAASLLQSQEINVNQQNQPTSLKQALVLATFDFSDTNSDGIWTADITAPPVDGQYNIITVIDYQDQRLEPKELSLVTVIDPEGYVYATINRGELRVNNAKVSLYLLNPKDKSYKLWPSKDYQQVNPQVTDNTGKYSFLVPEGTYYIAVQADGYAKYRGPDFDVKTNNGIHLNIELKTQMWWLQIVDWKTIIIIIILMFLAYNFYKDRKLKLEIKKLNSK